MITTGRKYFTRIGDDYNRKKILYNVKVVLKT